MGSGASLPLDRVQKKLGLAVPGGAERQPHALRLKSINPLSVQLFNVELAVDNRTSSFLRTKSLSTVPYQSRENGVLVPQKAFCLQKWLTSVVEGNSTLNNGGLLYGYMIGFTTKSIYTHKEEERMNWTADRLCIQ